MRGREGNTPPPLYTHDLNVLYIMENIKKEWESDHKAGIKGGWKCPNCNSSEVRYRTREKNHICRRCGNIW